MTEARRRRTGPSPSHLLPATSSPRPEAAPPRAQLAHSPLSLPFGTPTPALPGGGCTRVSPCRFIPCPSPQLPLEPSLYLRRPLRACTVGSLGTVSGRVGVPRAAGVGGGAGTDAVAGDDSCTRAPGYSWGRGARAGAATGGVSRVRPARERACGCACPDADWPARAVRVRARCQARTVGSRSAGCLRGWCAWAADSPDWPAGGGGGVGATLLGHFGRRGGLGAPPLLCVPVLPCLPSLPSGGAGSGLCPGPAGAPGPRGRFLWWK